MVACTCIRVKHELIEDFIKFYNQSVESTGFFDFSKYAYKDYLTISNASDFKKKILAEAITMNKKRISLYKLNKKDKYASINSNALAPR